MKKHPSNSSISDVSASPPIEVPLEKGEILEPRESLEKGEIPE